ncbi:hypothetical protein EMIHUDRAFT_229309 [Emiliania huxleyi CCMP1516]|uniref:Peptidase S9 prolyl oligopeptidase catalytic domain-containing protein n=2 Tax=Emiliania huxleyi TaxID=2903 RepID=A0A0D3KDF7_EMIH1|nr:hypothetical protein EMIHUDRAFT_229309 [Emiliania huxleyi CCMP1516]EOD33792.1 hypothetical protein EMIHUDRAFT_229309 [Emiliania huxleyi CCMP1516]|eukprot:XP_005786221.1 hypothetical protein EMIHUDRAFT_229309 [Emiliania huxleyi CCMP1516]
MKQPFLLVLTLAATHGESEDAASSKSCPCSPLSGIRCLFCTTIHLRLDCIGDIIQDEFFLPDDVNYTCGNGSTKTKIFYPAGPLPTTTKYPVVMFHRGTNGYRHKPPDVNGTGYDAWLATVAMECLIVIAPETDGGYKPNDKKDKKYCLRDKDLLIAMEWARANLTLLYPSLKADWDNVGAMGHSAGAHHLPKFVEDANSTLSVDIKATVFSHGGDDLQHNLSYDKPSFFLTANGDNRAQTVFPTANGDNRSHTKKSPHCTTPECSYAWFRGMNATNKVFANMQKGNHHEPHTHHQFANWTGIFLACHLYPLGSKTRAATCPRIYDVTPEICNQSSVSQDGPEPWNAPWPPLSEAWDAIRNDSRSLDKSGMDVTQAWNVPGCEVLGSAPP